MQRANVFVFLSIGNRMEYDAKQHEGLEKKRGHVNLMTRPPKLLIARIKTSLFCCQFYHFVDGGRETIRVFSTG
jgi:hypothetical protein